MIIHQNLNAIHSLRKYDGRIIKGWIATMKENKWSRAVLSRHIGISAKTIQRQITAYNYGEIE